MRARSTSLAGSDLDAPRCSSSTRSASESCMILTRLAIATLSHTLHHYTRELRDSPLALTIKVRHRPGPWGQLRVDVGEVSGARGDQLLLPPREERPSISAHPGVL